MHQRAAQQKSLLVRDVGVVALSILIAIVLVRTNALTNLLTSTAKLQFLGTFLAGLFFTSIFTTAPAVVTLGQIAQNSSLLMTAGIGALGAVLGDVLIFWFVEDKLEDHLGKLLSEEGMFKRTRKLFRAPLFRWLTFLAGGILLALPLPTDELAISILGAEKMRLSRFTLLSLVFNFLGILLIGLVARAV